MFVFGVGRLIAKASFVSLYPQTCAGDWQHVENAAGTALATEESESVFFNEENSALLLPGNHGALSCGQFQIDAVQGKILHVKLHLAWAFKDIPVPEIIPTPTDLPPSPAEEDPTDTAPLPPTEEPTPAIPPTSAPESQPEAFLRRLIPTASAAGPKVTAQLVFNGIQDFITIEYSFDGNEWQSIDNAGLEIPVGSWQDVQNIKIRIRTLDPEVKVEQAVYVEGMWLEAKYVEGDANADESAAGGSEPQTLTETAIDLLSEIPMALQDLVSDSTPSVVIDNADNGGSQIASTVVLPPDVPPHPDFTFVLDKTAPLTVPKSSSPLTALVSGAIDTTKTSADVSVRTELLGQGLTIEGTCSKQYFVILVFADPDDYATDPSRAVFNRASLCENGRYSYMLKSDDLPGSLADGTYYLFSGEQDEETAWILKPFVYLFKLGRR